MPASAPSVTPKQKKVYSKPLERTEAEQVLRNTASDWNACDNSTSEEARKKMRVARLRQQTAEINTQVINDPEAGQWAKQQSLKQIQMVREMKKKQMLNTVS